MPSSRNVRPWDIWLAYLRFADHPEVGKVRPIVIIDHRAAAFIVAKVTSAEPSERFAYCDLSDWQDEGLVRPSRVQVVPLFQVTDDQLLRDEPLGTLSDRDRMALRAALEAGA